MWQTIIMLYPIKNKALKNKAEKALWEMLKIKKTNWTQNLQFEIQDEETKRHFYLAIDKMKEFIDNIS